MSVLSRLELSKDKPRFEIDLACGLQLEHPWREPTPARYIVRYLVLVLDYQRLWRQHLSLYEKLQCCSFQLLHRAVNYTILTLETFPWLCDFAP